MSGWVAGAVVVGGLASSAIGAIGANSAADTQARAAGNAQQISQQQYQDTVNRNAPFTQSGYGALSALDWGLGITPQNANGQPVGQSGNGIDPSSGYRVGPGGSISQAIAGGSGSHVPPTYTGNHGYSAAPGSTFGGSSGIPSGMGPGGNVSMGQASGGAGAPAAAGSAPGQTGGLGYGSLTKAFDTSDWQQLSPAYNFQLRQGQQGVQNAASAGQGAMSGSALKDLTDYNQSAANQSFNSAFNQYQTQQGNIFSRLSGIAGLGQSSANNTGQQGTTLAGQAAQAASAQGSYSAAGTVGAANAISGGISNAMPWLTAGGGSGSGVDTGWIGGQANNTINNTDWSNIPVG